MSTKKEDKLTAGFLLPKPKAPTPIEESKAEAFEAKPFPVVVDAPKPVKVKASRLRNDKRGERVTCYLPPKLAEKLRVKCARERRSLSDALTYAVETWLQGTM